MNKSKIEWTNYTANPVKGVCPVGCSYCYARRLYQRFGWNPEIRYDPYWVEQIPKRRGHRIFVGSTMELFGPWVDARDLRTILHHCGQIPHHTFIFLTKMPQNLPRLWPDNCWVGVSATDSTSFSKATDGLMYVNAPVKFISVEPLLSPVRFYAERLPYCGINWLIIGQQTPVRKSTTPKIEWVSEIVGAADKAGVPVFLKDNLRALLPEEHPFYTFPWGRDPEAGESVLRQEFPNNVATTATGHNNKQTQEDR